MSPKHSKEQYNSVTILSGKLRFLPSSPPTPGEWAFSAGEGLQLPDLSAEGGADQEGCTSA